MSYSDTLLADGEHITYRAKQHWLAPAWEARWGVGLLVLAIVIFIVSGGVKGGGLVGTVHDFLGWITFGAFVIGVAWLFWTYLSWYMEDYFVTDRRVLKVEGVVNKHAADSSLEKINDAIVEQHLFGRLLGYGDLEILTAAEESVDRYHMLAHVLTFKRSMLNAKNAIEEGVRRPATPPLRAAATVPAAAPAAAPEPRMTPDEVTQTLARLADLRDRGAITPEEYEVKKAELLDRI